MVRTARRRDVPRVLAAYLALLMLVVLVFAGIRVAVDGPHLLAGTVPAADSFEHRYVTHAPAAYLHIVPGVLYLLGALAQLSRRVRRRHLVLHRRLGRVVLALGLLSGVFALVFGVPRAYGGFAEASAAAVFAAWFLLALVLAFRAVRRGDVAAHRRWMIRAFAVGVAVGTIRLWIGLFVGLGVLSLRESFGPAFWFSLVTHAAAAEWWLRRMTPERQRAAARSTYSRR